MTALKYIWDLVALLVGLFPVSPELIGESAPVLQQIANDWFEGFPFWLRLLISMFAFATFLGHYWGVTTVFKTWFNNKVNKKD